MPQITREHRAKCAETGSATGLASKKSSCFGTEPGGMVLPVRSVFTSAGG